MARALRADMGKIHLLTMILTLLWPIALQADDQTPEANVNERYVVEKIEFVGIDESKLSQSLRDEAQKMVGEKYSEQSAEEIAKSLRRELKGYDVDTKVERGEKAEQIKVVFQVKNKERNSAGADLPLLVYDSKEGFSAHFQIPFDIHHNEFSFGLVSDADHLLERYSGLRLRYEHRKLGTDLVHLRIDFDSYHEKFSPATETALAERPDVPGIYRTRQILHRRSPCVRTKACHLLRA